MTMSDTYLQKFKHLKSIHEFSVRKVTYQGSHILPNFSVNNENTD